MTLRIIIHPSFDSHWGCDLIASCFSFPYLGALQDALNDCYHHVMPQLIATTCYNMTYGYIYIYIHLWWVIHMWTCPHVQVQNDVLTCITIILCGPPWNPSEDKFWCGILVQCIGYVQLAAWMAVNVLHPYFAGHGIHVSHARTHVVPNPLDSLHLCREDIFHRIYPSVLPITYHQWTNPHTRNCIYKWAAKTISGLVRVAPSADPRPTPPHDTTASQLPLVQRLFHRCWRPMAGPVAADVVL